MIQKKSSQQELLILQFGGQVFFMVAFVLAVIFSKERMAFDTSHYLFELISRNGFFIAHQRPIGVVSQLLPVLGIWLGQPLKTLVLLYSVGDVLYYYLLFLFLAYGLKDIAGTLLILLTLGLTVKYTFYCPVTELLQGLALLSVWYALLYRSFRFRLLFLIVLLAIILFSHPLLFLPTGFVMVWWAVGLKNRGAVFNVLVVALVVLSVTKMAFLDQYDHQKTFYPMIFKDYSNLHNLQDLTFVLSFLKMLLLAYPVLALLFLASLAVLLINRDALRTTIYVLSVGGFILILVATHRFTGISNYSERMLFPLITIITLPFCTLLSNGTVKILNSMILILLFCFLFYRLNVIRETATIYTLRIQQMKELIQQAKEKGIQKVIADESVLEEASFAMTGWSYPIESLIQSSFSGADSSVTIIMLDEQMKRIQEQKRMILPTDFVQWTEVIFPDSLLPKKYFNLRTENYLPLRSNCEPDSSLTAAVEISINPTIIKLDPEHYCAELTFINHGKQKICSGDNSLILQLTFSKAEKPGSDIKYQYRIPSDLASTLHQWVTFYIEEGQGPTSLYFTLHNPKGNLLLGSSTLKIKQ